jgi:CHAD domain-containing protein
MVEPGKIFERLHSQFFAALEACRVRPEPKAVHRLRTTTRRLEALLTTAKRRRNGGARLARKIDKALKALKPIRGSAGPVRDLDVQMALLEGLVQRVGGSPARGTPGEAQAAGLKLQTELKRSRKHAAKQLREVIQNVEMKELKRLSPLQTELSDVKWMSLLKDAVKIERQSALRLDAGNPESLHDYRKRSKFSRYLAEMEDGSAEARSFGKSMKSVLDAIGAWHDWLLLTHLAKKTAGKSSELAKAAKQQRERALQQAVGAVELLHRKA